VAQDCELLGQLYGNADEGAIGAEELVDLFSHGLSVDTSNWCFVVGFAAFYNLILYSTSPYSDPGFVGMMSPPIR
jgi:hypothetical protein